MFALILAICLAATPADNASTPDVRLPIFNSEAEELKRQIGYVNADITGIRARLDKIELSIDGIQTGIVNRTSENSGWQILSGDLGTVALSAFFILCLTGQFLWYRFKITKLQQG